MTIINKKNLLFLIISFIIVTPIIVDSYLIHRTYQYFGGGALNKPYALTSFIQFIYYFFEAFIYDAFIYILLFSILFSFFSLLKKLSFSQKIYLSISFTIIVFFIYTVISIKICNYLKYIV